MRRRDLLLGLLAAGCAARPPPRRATSRARRDAAAVAHGIVETRSRFYQDGHVWGLFHVHAARGTSMASLCRAVYGVGYLFDAAGIDAADDIERAFVLSFDAVSYDASLEAIHVFEHRMPDERLREAFEAAVAASERAERFDELGFLAADIEVAGTPRLLAAPAPGLLVTLPASEITGAIQLVGSGGLPLRTGAEVASFAAARPSEALLGVEIPSTVTSMRVAIELTPHGGAHVRFAAKSNAAADDARWMTERLEQVLSLDLRIARLQLLGPYLFRSAGDEVRSDIVLSREETDWVVGMARTLMPGG